MKTSLLNVAAALALAVPSPSAAEAPQGTPIAIGTSHALTSTVLKGDREINIHLPASYAAAKEPRRYPVLYVLDGGVDQDFVHIAGVAQHGAMSWTFDEFIVSGSAPRSESGS